MSETKDDNLSSKVHNLDRIVRGTDASPGHGARLHNAEQRISRLEENEQFMKDWDNDRLRLWVVVVVSILMGLVSLISSLILR